MTKEQCDSQAMTDLDTVPAIAMTQWREGRVLSADDVMMVNRLLSELDAEMAEATNAFHNGRKQALFEIGGAELVAAAEKADLASCEISLKRAFAHYAEKCAALDKLNN